MEIVYTTHIVTSTDTVCLFSRCSWWSTIQSSSYHQRVCSSTSFLFLQNFQWIFGEVNGKTRTER